jgi:hypothetical protein
VSLVLDVKDVARVCVSSTVCCLCVLRVIIRNCIRESVEVILVLEF